MKTIFIICGIGLTFWLACHLQQAGFEDCMSAGIQSEDTCKLYSY